jgi:ribose-phosphate pyrophosphokinase
LSPTLGFGELDLLAPLLDSGCLSVGRWIARRFPDGEQLLRLASEVAGRDVVVAARLNDPDHKLIGATMAADTLRRAGARRVLLAAPYLPYLRQDEQFRSGESVGSAYLAKLLPNWFDGLATVDPHLHRTPDLSALFGDWPALHASAAPALGDWARKHAAGATIVGPDEESHQWAVLAAQRSQSHWTVMDKVRHGDADVRVACGSTDDLSGDVVLVDDIISTGATLVAAAGVVKACGGRVIACVAVHGIFAPGAVERLHAAGLHQIVTTSSVVGPSSIIDVAPALCDAVEQLL